MIQGFIKKHYRSLGYTDLIVSPLGLGTVKLGRNSQVKYPNSFSLPNSNQVIELLSIAKDMGINLLDTAPAYGNSECILGNIIAPQRDYWIISTKIGEEFLNNQSYFDFSPDYIQFSIERSLKRLKTDYLDIVLVHSNGKDISLIQNDDVFSVLEKLKMKGHLRYYGMSSKTIEGGVEAVKKSDVVMVSYNPIDTSQTSVLEVAEQLNKGVLIKKALAGGHLNKFNHTHPLQHIYKQLFDGSKKIHSVIVGTINIMHLKENVKTIIEVIDG